MNQIKSLKNPDLEAWNVQDLLQRASGSNLGSKLVEDGTLVEDGILVEDGSFVDCGSLVEDGSLLDGDD